MKARLDESALPEPIVAVGGKQAVAQKSGQFVKVDGRFAVVAVIFLQNMLNDLRPGAHDAFLYAAEVETVRVAVAGYVFGDDF